MLFLHRALLLFFTLTLPLQAQFGFSSKHTPSKASLVAELAEIAPGATFSVALTLEHPAGWHSYYRNSGGLELPPAIEWSLPEGFSAGPIQWPSPQVKDGYFGKSFVYTGSPSFLVDITAPTDLAVGSTAALHAKATWQICEESCINEDASFTLQLPVADAPAINEAHAQTFQQARAKLPARSESWTFSARDGGDSVLLRFDPGADFAKLPSDFIPDQPFVQSVSSGGEITRDGDQLLIRLPRATKDALDNEIPQGEAISGIVIGDGESAMVPLTPIGAASSAPTPAATAKITFASLLPILGGMFLGGLILNLMPCVFPVIGLKIMGFVQQAGSERNKVILHGVTFTLGVLASFAVISGILFAARGDAVGWGYQLQNPWVVLALMVLMFLLALSMFGIFEIGISVTSVGGSLQSKQGLAGSFFSGILATVVATPCSAPFLGAAIGAAIALPAVQFFAAFGAMALGLSTPYLLLSIFPKLIAFLPRPGAWMVAFKQGMSFLLFATAGYLLWVYAGQIGLDNLLGPIFGLSAIATAAWVYGRWNLPSHAPLVRLIAVVIAIAFAAAGLHLAKPPTPSALEWQTWSPEKVEALLEEGTPVYIDFTAKWCATCQVNKKRAYTAEVIALMNEKGVVALRADKTTSNPAIDQAIEQLGRSAIPVNVLLAPGMDPVILPELLSPDDVIEALEGLD